MTARFTPTCILLALALLTSTLPAQIPPLINYQGRVAVGGVNFEGTGQFKFALIRIIPFPITFWSNDGTSAIGAEPTAAVSLTVTKGLYSVLLGDGNLPNMTAIPSSVFSNPNVFLRVWFNDGVKGFQLLTPDQRIASVGYAMIAANVPDGAITTAKIAAGAVGSTQLAAGAVQSGNIAAGAVGSAQIAPGTIDFTSLTKPPQSGTLDGAALTWAFGRAYFTVTFPQAFAAAPVIALSLAPGSATFPSEATAQVLSSSATGFTGKLAAYSLFEPAPVTVASTGVVGDYSSLAVVNGAPAISFWDTTNSALKYARASDANGTSWALYTVDLGGTNDVGVFNSLAVVLGNPAISYQDITDFNLKYVRANDVNGTTWSAPTPVTVDSVGNVGSYTSLAVVNSFPAISYYDETNSNLKFVRAADIAGLNWGAPVIVDSTGAVGEYTSLAVISGNPAISYYDSTNSALKYVRATNTAGTAWGTPLTLDSGGAVGYFTSLTVINGNPAVSYWDGTNTALKYVRATNANGTTWGTPLTLDSAGDVGSFTSLAVINGHPAVSYLDDTNDSLKFVRATDANGTAWDAPITIDRTGLVGIRPTLAEVNGTAAISYFDFTNSALKFIRSPSPPSNFKINWIALPP